MACASAMTAQASDDKSTPIPIAINIPPDQTKPKPPIHRAPMRICVDAYYDALSGSISIIYDGEAEGEVNLYSDGVLIDSSSEISTTFLISDSGVYTIEIVTESWTATGSIEININEKTNL